MLEVEQGTQAKGDDKTEEDDCGRNVDSVEDEMARLGLGGLAVGAERGAHGPG